MAMRCIICDKATAFVKKGWFGYIFPLCKDHYPANFVYGAKIFCFKGDQELTTAYEKNIIKTATHQ